MRIFAVSVCLLFAAPTWAGIDAEMLALDPSQEADRARLFSEVRSGGRGANIAARKLAEAGLVEQLLKILESTEIYSAMGAITQAVGAASIPTVEGRLERDPFNPRLLGVLQPPSDPRVTRWALRALEAPDLRTVAVAARKLIRCVDVEGLRDVLHRRFHAAPREDVRVAFALALIRRGDRTPVPWFGERLRTESLEALDLVVWLADRNEPFPFDDASILAPLIPDLIGLLDSKWPNVPRDACRTLQRLTRHRFAPEVAPWRMWYETHRDRPLIYTRALHEAIGACAKAFEDSVHALDRNHLCSADDGPWYGKKTHVWRVENPRAVVTAGGWNWPDGTPVEQPRFRIQLDFSLQTNAADLEGHQFEMRMNRINVVVRLRLGEGGTPEQRAAVISAARKACEGLVKYEEAHR